MNSLKQFPLFGLGTYKLLGDECTKAVEFALENEITLIDTASFYGNETEIGKALANTSIDRDAYNVVTKIWTDEMREGNVEKALMQSLKKLQLEYLDAYLVHWPVVDKWEKAFEQMLRFQEEGVIRKVGVCNFNIEHLEKVKQEFDVYPFLNQVEMHMQFQQNEMQEFCKEQGILAQAWRPLMNGTIGEVEVLKEIGGKYNKSPFQVILRYFTQKGVGVIPKSSKSERILENSSLFDFNLSEDELLEIAALNKDARTGPDPLTFDF